MLLLFGLLPAIALSYQALTIQPTEASSGSLRQQKRRRILAKIPTDASVLINITRADMPATPDILDLGKRSTKALERCLSDNVDESNRSLCAMVLAALGDRRALPTLQTALDDWEPPVRYWVVAALGAMPDSSSVKPLIKLYRRKDEKAYIRTAVLRALGTISDQHVVRFLRKELVRKPKDKDSDARPELFDALWSNRHLVARNTLIADTRKALASDNNSLALSATLAAAELRAPRLAGALIPLMEHQWAEVRNKAVYALGRIGDKKATKALLARLPKVRDARMLNNIAFALERLDKKSFYQSIKQVIEHKQAVIRLNAAFVLGDVKHPEGLPMLQKALQDASDYVRTSAIVAVGKLGTTNQAQRAQAIGALEPLTKHANLSVREEAVYAIHKLTKGGRADLVHKLLFAKLNDRKQRTARERAAITLGKTGDMRVRRYLLDCLLKHGCSLDDVKAFFTKNATASDKGRLLLSWSRGELWLDELVAQVKPAGTLPLARSVLEDAWARPRASNTRSALLLLGGVGDASLTALLTRRANTKKTWPRLHARVALTRLGDGAAANKLIAEVGNLPSSYLPHFAHVVRDIKEPKIRSQLDSKLEALQKSPDAQIALAVAAIRLRWFPDKAIYRFIDGLASPQALERDIAEAYLNWNKGKRVTWLLRRALAREGRVATRNRLRAILDRRN